VSRLSTLLFAFNGHVFLLSGNLYDAADYNSLESEYVAVVDSVSREGITDGEGSSSTAGLRG
jgi:hypothetical protein